MIYTKARCLVRAESVGDTSGLDRLASEHEEVAKYDPDPEVQRIARGYAMVARARGAADEYRKRCYERLAAGEDITKDRPETAPPARGAKDGR